MYKLHVNRVLREAGGISPSLCPKGTSTPAPRARKRNSLGSLQLWALGCLPMQGKSIKKNNRNSGLISRTSFSFFPNLPATILQRPRTAAVNVRSGVSYLQPARNSINCAHPTVSGRVTPAPQQQACECSFLKADVFGGHSHDHFLRRRYKVVAVHSVNQVLLGTQKSEFLVKIKQFSSASDKWVGN